MYWREDVVDIYDIHTVRTPESSHRANYRVHDKLPRGHAEPLEMQLSSCHDESARLDGIGVDGGISAASP
ncbi:uncharacterized protein EAF02_004314 [Botrytis sinoallii]|uniref:uncharacterized protein n=1 Tax=Botrytis sinoallii TaxID=1463999 RepID=UPI00190202E5|nr:uncharacterized protein EAF02_004314 [Botrytis sinoallii]KAF7885805.1 hypothetical protein EAF02_004314 [Botrytis sinoallii]